MTRHRPVFRFRIVLEIILVYLMPSLMADDSFIWDKQSSTRNFLQCCTDTMQKQEIEISDNFFNGVKAARDAIENSSSEIRSSIMNGGFSDQIASLCKTINCEETDNVLIKIVAYCSEKVTGHRYNSLTHVLKSTLSSLLKQSTTSDYKSTEESNYRPSRQQKIAYSQSANHNNPSREKNSNSRENVSAQRDISESSAMSSAYAKNKQSDGFSRLEKKKKKAISTPNTYRIHDQRVDNTYPNTNQHHVPSNAETLPQNIAVLKLGQTVQPYPITKHNRQVFSKASSKSGSVVANRQNIPQNEFRNLHTDDGILNRRSKYPKNKNNRAHSSITQIRQSDDVAEADALLNGPRLNYHSNSNYPASVDSASKKSSASSRSSSSVVSGTSLNTHKQSRAATEPRRLIPRKAFKRQRKPETKVTKNSGDFIPQSNQPPEEQNQLQHTYHAENIHPTGKNKQRTDSGRQLISTSLVNSRNSIFSKQKERKVKTNGKKKPKNRFIKFNTDANSDDTADNLQQNINLHKDTKNHIFSYINSVKAEERIEILKKLVLSCIQNGKFDYKLLGIYIYSLTKEHPKFGTPEAHFQVLSEIIKACTQILIKSPPDCFECDKLQNVPINSQNAYNIQHIQVPNMQNVGAPNMPNLVVSNMQNMAESNMENGEAKNVGVPNTQNTEMLNMQNANVPSFQNTFVPSFQNAFAPSQPNSFENSLLNANSNFQSMNLPNPQIENNSNSQNINMPNLYADDLQKTNILTSQNNYNSDNTDLVPHFANEPLYSYPTVQQPLLSPQQTKPNVPPGSFWDFLQQDRQIGQYIPVTRRSLK